MIFLKYGKIKLYLFPANEDARARPGQRRSILKRIFVSFKMVNDYEQVLPEDWDAFLQEDAALDYVRQIVNCFDESALELALRIKDYYSQIGEETELTALTIANDSPSFLKPYLQRDMTGVIRLTPLSWRKFFASVHRGQDSILYPGRTSRI